MRITIVIYSLVAGGAERVMSTIANYWAQKGWTVNLLTLDSGKEPPFYPLHPDVRHQPLGLGGVSTGVLHALWSNVDRVRKLGAAIRQTNPDIIISTLSETNVHTLLATKGMGVPTIVREAIDPYSKKLGWPWNALRRWTYSRATCAVFLTERMASYFALNVRKRARVIPNPVMLAAQPRKPFLGDGHPKTIIAMGRLVFQKGFDILLQAFARIAKKHPDWSLEILGEGPARKKLEAQAESLGLRDRVRLPGTTNVPHEKLRQADLFVMSSRYEGFPSSLSEAMACGLPAISFDCRTGPREIIRDGIDGVLVPPEDVAALSEAMDRLMTDGKQRESLASRAPEVLERFGLQKIMGMWEVLIEEITTGRQPRQQ